MSGLSEDQQNKLRELIREDKKKETFKQVLWNITQLTIFVYAVCCFLKGVI